MNYNFTITGIERIVYVSRLEYPNAVTHFGTALGHSELIYHFSGDAVVYYDDSVLHTTKNSIRFLPDIKASRYTVVSKEPGDCIDIEFTTTPSFFEKAFVENINNKNLGILFKKIFSVWTAKDEGYYFECIGLLYKIFAEMQKKRYLPQNQFEQIRPAVEYINSRFFKEKISAQKISELCGISYSYIKVLFYKKYGLYPKQYIVHLKVNYACDLLSRGSYSVVQTASMCGYEDTNFFSRQFKEHVGISPTQFRDKYKSSK